VSVSGRSVVDNRIPLKAVCAVGSRLFRSGDRRCMRDHDRDIGFIHGRSDASRLWKKIGIASRRFRALPQTCANVGRDRLSPVAIEARGAKSALLTRQGLLIGDRPCGLGTCSQLTDVASERPGWERRGSIRSRIGNSFDTVCEKKITPERFTAARSPR
jgi:hypothetical protein